MYSPVDANTATLAVPPTPTVTLPPELTTVTLLVPLLIFDELVLTPVSNAPLPKIYPPLMLAVVVILPVPLITFDPNAASNVVTFESA